RAFLKNAPILILDEPTSALDLQTEASIIDALHRLVKGRTTLMIAHRPSTLRACDSLLLLEPNGNSRMTREVGSSVLRMASAVARVNGGPRASQGPDPKAITKAARCVGRLHARNESGRRSRRLASRRRPDAAGSRGPRRRAGRVSARWRTPSTSAGAMRPDGRP